MNKPEEIGTLSDRGNEKSIVALGFQDIGFNLPPFESFKLNENNVMHAISFSSDYALPNIEQAEGIIIPTGIVGSPYIRDYSKLKELILDIENSAYNLLDDDKWVCFLIGGDRGRSQFGINFVEYELADRFLQKRSFGGYDTIEEKPNEIYYTEFKSYLAKYGISTLAPIALEGVHSDDMIISKSASGYNAFQLDNKLFILPFNTSERHKMSLWKIGKLIFNAITDFRANKQVESNDWIKEFKFNEEIDIHTKIEALQKQIETENDKLTKFEDYKTILLEKDEVLQKHVIKILREYFDLTIDDTDEYVEDARIIDDTVVKAVIEIKGVNRNIKMKDVSQVDTHRERHNLNTTTPGILIVNNNMSVHKVDLKEPVDFNVYQHAKAKNVLILRAVDFLYYMKQVENIASKKDEFMSLLTEGGGWLKANNNDFDIV